MRLKNRKVLITGGAKRIGRILSLLIARERGEVIIHHNNSFAEAKSLQNDIQKLGQIAVIYQADFSDLKSLIKIGEGFNPSPIFI